MYAATELCVRNPAGDREWVYLKTGDEVPLWAKGLDVNLVSSKPMAEPEKDLPAAEAAAPKVTRGRPPSRAARERAARKAAEEEAAKAEGSEE